MSLSLTPQLEEWVKQKANSVLYNSVNEVISEALNLLDERDHFREMKLNQLRKKIAVGIEQANKGEITHLDFETIKTKGRKLLSSKENNDNNL